MAQKVSGAKTKGWEPNTGPGWTVTPGRQSENVVDLRLPSAFTKVRQMHEFFEKPGSDLMPINPILNRGKPLSEIRGPHEGWDPLGAEGVNDLSSWEQSPNGYRFNPSTPKKMISNYAQEEPGRLIPVAEIEGLHPDWGLAPEAETQYGDYVTEDVEMGGFSAFSPWVKRSLGQATRMPGMAAKARLKKLGDIAKNPIPGYPERQRKADEETVAKFKKRHNIPFSGAVGIAPVYGATPVTGMGGGLPYKDTLDRSMLNYEQSLLLKKALAGMRKK